MWTPRRVLLLASGFAVFLAGYLGYAYVLGGIDGLPPLPEALWPAPAGKPPVWPPNVRHATTAEEMLQTAFGAGAPELKYAIKVGSSTRGVALAAVDFKVKDDGRVILLEPVSLALFGKAAPGKPPEINTLRASRAYLTLDQAITGPNDINSRKIVAAELLNKITIVHNRRTPQQDDDIVIYVPEGPVHFDDAKKLITTNDALRLEDMSSKPRPMQVRAVGLEVRLGAGAAAGGPKPPPKPKAEREAAVERIVLRANVSMHLYVKPGSGFPVPGRDEGKKDEPAKPAKPGEEARDHIQITTNGPFHYDLLTDVARFDIPDNPSRRLPEHVEVKRNFDQEGKGDSLICEHLVLKLRRRAAEKPAPPAGDKPAPAPKGGGPDVEIETAHATGKEVVVASEAEFLDAHGNDLFFDARARRTVLKGDPEMWLLKEGNEIHARELELVSHQGGQKVSGRGPGRVHLLDKGGKRYHARWREAFSSARDGAYDVITVSGNAAFLEDDGALDPRDVLDDAKLPRCKSLLRADTLQVKLEPRKPSAPGQKREKGGTKPAEVEAIGHVQARSPEMVIKETDRLVIHFKDAAPEAPAPPENGKPLTTPAPASPGEGRPAGAAPAGDQRRADPATPQRPIELSARFVKAYVLRLPPRDEKDRARTELDRLQTEGAVRVTQAPAGPDDKGVEIKGAILTLERQPGGNRLVVSGDDNDLAQLRLDKIDIRGLSINIDQAANHAYVAGAGEMILESATDFQGNKLARPVPLDVLWNKTMHFDGRTVEFHGDVQTQQGLGRMRCEDLTVTLDRPVSLKEGKGGKESPRATKMTADRRVWVTQQTADKETGALTGFQRLDCAELNVLTEDGVVRATGPGWARMVQPGHEAGPLGAAPAPAKPAAEEWGLTLVSYAKSMVADNRKRTADFYERVEAVYVPWDPARYAEQVDMGKLIDQLPVGGLHLRCQHLTVYGGSKGRKDKTMDARGAVIVKAVDAKGQTFWGSAEQVHYDEAKDQVILDGGEGLAELQLMKRKGAQPEVVRGEQITYDRRAGTFVGKNLRRISGRSGTN